MAGVGGSIGFDAGAGAGFGGFPGLGLGGFGAGYAPYVPVTPLGALESYKGDLIYPIVAVGVALFILLIIVLAVKAALAWKLELLDSLTGHKARRDVTSDGPTPIPHDQEQMSWLTRTVMSALENENCSQRIVCQMGTYAKGTAVPSYMSWLEAYMAEDYKDSLTLFKNSAEGKVDCNQFKCGAASTPSTSTTNNTNSQTPVTAQQFLANNSGSKSQQQQQQQQGIPQKSNANVNDPITSNTVQM